MGEYKTARTLCEQLGRMFSSTRKRLGMAGVGIRLPPCRQQASTGNQCIRLCSRNEYAEGSTKRGEVFVRALLARRSESGLETLS